MISLVVCSRDNSRFDPFAARIAKVFGGVPHELIRIADATGMAAGYTRGLALAKGDHLVFCHDDIEFIGEDVPERIVRHLERWDGIGLAGTDRLVSPRWLDAGPPHIFGQVAHPIAGGYRVCIYGVPQVAVGGVQGFDGLCMAFRREVIERVGWDQSYSAFHGYDTDASYRAYRSGFRLAVVCDIPVIHASGGNFGAEWKIAAQQFMTKHGGALAPELSRAWSFATVEVRTKLEALDVMTPPYLT